MLKFLFLFDGSPLIITSSHRPRCTATWRSLRGSGKVDPSCDLPYKVISPSKRVLDTGKALFGASLRKNEYAHLFTGEMRGADPPDFSIHLKTLQDYQSTTGRRQSVGSPPGKFAAYRFHR